MFLLPVNRLYPGKNDWKLTIFTLARFSGRIFRIWNKDFWRKLMPTFCRKPHVASFYSSLIQPNTKLCHRKKDRIRTKGHTDEIIYVRFRRYICISFANLLLCKKYIAELKYRVIGELYSNYKFTISNLYGLQWGKTEFIQIRCNVQFWYVS